MIVALLVVAISIPAAGSFRALRDAVCVLAVFPFLVWQGTLVNPGPLLRRVATLLGLTSFAIYALHSPLSSVLYSGMRYFRVGDTSSPWVPVLGVVFLVSVFLVAILVDRIFDVPVRRYLASIIPGRKVR
jgi:peptidoglycan/LPS O-acetylase OafA/YrhL